MTSDQQFVLMPSYIQKFKCIGSVCEDTCCSGWRVEIDKDTFYKYKTSKAVTLKPLFNRYVKRNKNSKNNTDYGKIIMGEHRRCPFLDKESLCSIQKNFGEDYLSNTCWSYPKIHNSIDDQIERIGVMSCPEIVRKALFNPEGIIFEKLEISICTKDAFVGRHKFLGESFVEKPEKYFWEIRIMSLSILQNRKYPFDQRMVLLGMFFQNLMDAIERNEVSDIPAMIDTFDDMLNSKVFDYDLKAIKFDPETQINVIRILMKIKKDSGVIGERYTKCFNETVEGLGFEQKEIATEALDYSMFKNFLLEKEYLFENYVVSEFFRDMMPFGGYKTIWESYIFLCTMFSMVKIHLLGVSLNRGKIDDEMVVEVVQSLSKEIMHNPFLFQSFIDVIKESGFSTLEYMALFTRFPDK